MKKTRRIDDTSCRYHQMMPYHTMQQAKMFFACGKDLQIESLELKERAKKHFKKDCFNKLTKDEMKWLIDTLQRKIYDKGRKENERMGTHTQGAER